MRKRRMKTTLKMTFVNSEERNVPQMAQISAEAEREITCNKRASTPKRLIQIPHKLSNQNIRENLRNLRNLREKTSIPQMAQISPDKLRRG